MSTFQTIVAATDFSDTAGDAVDTALWLARTTGARLHLLHVVPDPMHEPWMVKTVGLDFEALQQAWIDESGHGLHKQLAARQVVPNEVVTAVVVGSPATKIAEYAVDHRADLIVVGTHGWGTVRRFLMGSVAEKLLRVAGAPVMIVPHRVLRTGDPHELAAAVSS